jgi:hypothetical protein
MANKGIDWVYIAGKIFILMYIACVLIVGSIFTCRGINHLVQKEISHGIK